MFDIGWTELLLIGVVALIVVGPKDLPHLFHSLGRFTAKARGMAREFTSAMEDAAKGSGLDEASNSIRDLKSLTSKKSLGLDALDRAAERFEKWDPKIPDAKARPKPDPGATPQPAGDGLSPASEPAAPPPIAVEPAAPDHAADAATPGQRRLHAVRRSDRKDH
ncbi:MAG: Sec-independent protein translocase protein TatB [Paracoccus sp. (in: a-proteobacteria)]|jgi:sec-independent protein translocase protein TatB|uniref:Sec-independent protein translocase protein TatB n=1 Tax=unclassified Paracoccus (in: a-proteobacteria) TaxID=2688777 RepID=UPI0025D0E72E|nr:MULTISPECIES: Sec-independent protein translocase protein TatB [unclassified Paracoccus (in: a-proteobacteria)]|tara:strand:- start:1638 stop:2129 length:492 start_codon:yes stop_codon:yes gene_type:complete